MSTVNLKTLKTGETKTFSRLFSIRDSFTDTALIIQESQEEGDRIGILDFWDVPKNELVPTSITRP